MENVKLQSRTPLNSLIQKAFSPRLIEDTLVSFYKEDERGKFYLLRHPQTLEFVKLHEHAYEAVKRLTGAKTIGEIEEDLKVAGISLDLLQLVQFLAEEGFIRNLTRSNGEKAPEQKWFSHQMRLVTLSDIGLRRITKVFSFVSTTPFKICYTVFCSAGLVLFLWNLSWMLTNLEGVSNLGANVHLFILGAVAFSFLRGLHELAHASVYSFYGGQSVEMGLEFHFMTPMAYTDTPDVYIMRDRQRIMVFGAGPLLDLLLAAVFSTLVFLAVEPRIFWAIGAFAMYASILLSLMPIIRTDGYYIAQTLSKFPNLLEHGISNICQIARLILRRISLREYRNYLADYSTQERKILAAYTAILPITVLTLSFFGIFVTLKAQILAVVLLTPQILAGKISDLRIQVLWLTYIVTVTLVLYGMIHALLGLLRKRKLRLVLTS